MNDKVLETYRLTRETRLHRYNFCRKLIMIIYYLTVINYYLTVNNYYLTVLIRVMYMLSTNKFDNGIIKLNFDAGGHSSAPRSVFQTFDFVNALHFGSSVTLECNNSVKWQPIANCSICL